MDIRQIKPNSPLQNLLPSLEFEMYWLRGVPEHRNRSLQIGNNDVHWDIWRDTDNKGVLINFQKPIWILNNVYTNRLQKFFVAVGICRSLSIATDVMVSPFLEIANTTLDCCMLDSMGS
jgi:hypothetical protein